MQKASLVRVGDQLIIRSPYNAGLVEEVKGIPGRRWNPDIKVWSVPIGSEVQAREIVRQFFQIEGEPSYIEYETVRVRVTGKTSSTRYYCGGVTIDGRDVFSPTHGYLDTRKNDEFEILEQKGGFVSGDGYIKRGKGHAFAVEYELLLRVRKNAEWKTTGRAEYWGTYEIIPNDEDVLEDRQGVRKDGEA